MADNENQSQEGLRMATLATLQRPPHKTQISQKTLMMTSVIGLR